MTEIQPAANASQSAAEKASQQPVVIMGAGPAGLTAAYELSKGGVRSVILEEDSVVGGISRTAEYKGYLFDIGGHRFFTKVNMVEWMWREVLADDFIQRPRLSRIFYNNKFFMYPLQPMNALTGLGIFEAIRCGLSWFMAHLRPELPENDLEAWVSNRFGKRLFQIFFKTYTEKVWGIPCRKIRADWAAQRIKGLSMRSLIVSTFQSALGIGKKDKQKVIKTLIDQFDYPRRGPGMMWTKTTDILGQRGSNVVFHSPVEKIFWEPGRVKAIQAGGKMYAGNHFISSIPIKDLIERMDPEPPVSLKDAALDFHYRDFLTVALMIRGKDLFPDNWIYIHSSDVKVGRVQNYNNWSPEMVPDPETTCLGLEYFCFEGDGLWTSKDEDLIELAKREVARIGLVTADKVFDGTVVRMRKAYPVYDETYKRGLDQVQAFLKTVPNLQLVGRNGMHRYNNQDHSMLTAMLAAKNILGAHYDLWKVNVDADYHEEGGEIADEEIAAMQATQPRVPAKV